MAGIGTPALSAGASVTITSLLGITTKGQAAMANSLPVVLASDQSSIPVSATLNAETTKVIGVVRNSDGAGNLLTSNSTTPAAHFALDTNITSILGTAPTTVGKLDVKGADGDVFVRQTTGSNLHVQVDTAPSTAVTNVGTFAVQEATLDAALIAQEATTSGVKGITVFGAVTTAKPTYVTGKSDALSLDVNGLLRISLADTPANTNKFLVTADAITIASAQTLATVTNVTQLNGVGPTFNSTATAGKQGLDINVLSILGTAPTTAGFIDIKGADGNVFVRQTTATNLKAQVVSGDATGAAIPANAYYIAGFDGANLAGIRAFSDGDASGNTNSLVAAARGYVYNGTNWDRLRSGGVTGAGMVSGDTASGSSDAGNPLKIGGIGLTALPTPVSTTQRVSAMLDKFGRQIVLPITIRDLVGTQTTTISASTAETTIVTQAASVFNDLLLLVISNTSATATRIDFRDTTGGSVLFSLEAPATDTRGFSLGGVAIPQTTVNTNWTAQSSASVTDLRIYAVFAKNR